MQRGRAAPLLLLLCGSLASALNIFPLGDSLTQCDAPDRCYRRWLQALLQHRNDPFQRHWGNKKVSETKGGEPTGSAFLEEQGAAAAAPVTLDFVGSMSAFYNFSSSGAKAPAWFDEDHEGHWGWGVDELLTGCSRCPHVVRGRDWPSGRGKLSEWLSRNDGVGDDDGGVVDYALLHVGTNDLWMDGRSVQATVADVGQVLRVLMASNPSMVIFLSLIVPCPVIPAAKWSEYNSLLARLAVKGRVVIVDQATGFDPGRDLMADGVTPTVSGSQKIASRFYRAMGPFLPSLKPGQAYGTDDVRRAISKAGGEEGETNEMPVGAFGSAGVVVSKKKGGSTWSALGGGTGGSGGSGGGSAVGTGSGSGGDAAAPEENDTPSDLMGGGNSSSSSSGVTSSSADFKARGTAAFRMLKDVAALVILFVGVCVACTGAHIMDFVLAFLGFCVGGFTTASATMWAQHGTVHLSVAVIKQWAWLYLGCGFLGGMAALFLVHRYRLFHLITSLMLSAVFLMVLADTALMVTIGLSPGTLNIPLKNIGLVHHVVVLLAGLLGLGLGLCLRKYTFPVVVSTAGLGSYACVCYGVGRMLRVPFFTPLNLLEASVPFKHDTQHVGLLVAWGCVFLAGLVGQCCVFSGEDGEGEDGVGDDDLIDRRTGLPKLDLSERKGGKPMIGGRGGFGGTGLSFKSKELQQKYYPVNTKDDDEYDF